MDYWKECISEAFEDAGLTATDEQKDTVTSWAYGAHENFGLANGHDAIPNPQTLENDKLSKDLREQRDKADQLDHLPGKVENLEYLNRSLRRELETTRDELDEARR